jgi:hypothetical protein
VHAESSHIHSAGEALEQWLATFKRGDWRRLAFYLGVPTVFALYWATMDAGVLEVDGVWPILKFYIAHAYVPWWITCLSTRAIYIALAALRPPAPLLWALGAVLSCFLLIPYMNWIGLGMQPDAGSAQAIPASYFAMHLARVVLVWMLINFLFDRYAGLPRYRYGQLANAKKPAATTIEPVEHPAHIRSAEEEIRMPDFLDKVSRLKSPEELYSVSAEEHYVRVHTADGDELVYKRFSDAVRELETIPGIRIHRSHWVSPYAVCGVIKDGKRMWVKLRDNQKLPVSRPYQAMVKDLAERCTH